MTQAKDRLDKSTILGLVAMALAVLVVANDFTALSVALPAMEKEFGADLSTVQWVINGYALVFGVLIVTGGRLADMFGRRWIFFLGATVFAVFSVGGGLAPNVGVRLGCRALMEIGGAMMWPAILGMTYALLPSSKAGLAGGLIIGAAGFGNAMGPLLGGVLTDALSWRWIFFLNLPIAAFAMLVTWWVVQADEKTLADHRVDYAGIIFLSIGLFALHFALDEGIDLGWTDPLIIGLFVLAVVALVRFILVEQRSGATALVPNDVIKNGTFFSACIAVLLMSAIFFAALLYLPQFMTKVLGYSAAASGVGLLPMMITFAVTSFVAGPLYEKMGPKLIVSLGAAFLAGGIFLLSLVRPTTTYDGLVAGMVVLGIGVGLFYSSITTAAVTALDPSRSSLAGGIVYMCQIAGGGIGLGLNTAIVMTAGSLVEGIGRAFMVDAMLGVGGLVVAILFVGGRVDKERLRM
ncbi:MAG TPA: DHA2 family efflux MFS transporter permease subunit, partial [Terriglobales bacterium]|nr:DHA2 family efflux MFS transporter permease subunit [Terriglobales bacterium]